MKVETFTTKPENLEGSDSVEHSTALRENFSSSSGRNPACDSLVLTDSLLSVSSVDLAIWYAKLGCSGWYLGKGNDTKSLLVWLLNEGTTHLKATQIVMVTSQTFTAPRHIYTLLLQGEI